MTGTRYYSIGGKIVAARTGASTVAYLAGDSQGTDSVAIDSATLAVTRRYYDPYGNPRGTAPPSFPAGQKSFVGGAADSSTGLTDLGIREYQPGTGSFVSPDALVKPFDPQDLNPYAYAGDNPVTRSDPSGASTTPGGSGNLFTGPYGCTGATEAALQACVKARTPGTGTTKPSGRGSAASPTVKISAHVYATANDPQLPGLKQAYQWAVRVFGKPHNAAQESARWTQACAEFRKACAGEWASVVGPFTASPALLNSWHMGTETLLGAGNVIAGIIFPNQLLNRWAAEQRLGEQLDVPTARPNDPAWNDIIRGNDVIKWAVLEDGDLVIMPKFVGTTEVPHSLLSGGEGVRAAGEAEIAYVPGQPAFGIDINNHSGHFRPSEGSVRLAVDAFADAGINFEGFDDTGEGVGEDG